MTELVVSQRHISTKRVILLLNGMEIKSEQISDDDKQESQLSATQRAFGEALGATST